MVEHGNHQRTTLAILAQTIGDSRLAVGQCLPDTHGDRHRTRRSRRRPLQADARRPDRRHRGAGHHRQPHQYRRAQMVPGPHNTRHHTDCRQHLEEPHRHRARSEQQQLLERRQFPRLPQRQRKQHEGILLPLRHLQAPVAGRRPPIRRPCEGQLWPEPGSQQRAAVQRKEELLPRRRRHDYLPGAGRCDALYLHMVRPQQRLHHS